jgi:hypothetical protein
MHIYIHSYDIGTSKYNNDTSFGYKGESLNSILHLVQSMKISSRVDLTDPISTKSMSRNSLDNIVTKSFINASNLFGSVGTMVECIDIFGSQPVRKKSLYTNIDQEVNRVRMTVMRISLVHPHIQFTLRLNNRMIWRTLTMMGEHVSQYCSLQAVKHQFNVLFGSDSTDYLEELNELCSNDTVVDGIASSPYRLEQFSTSNNMQLVFLNNRYCPDTIAIKNLINRAFKQYVRKFRDYIKDIHKCSEERLQTLLNRHPIFVIRIFSTANIHEPAITLSQTSTLQVIEQLITHFFDMYYPEMEQEHDKLLVASIEFNKQEESTQVASSELLHRNSLVISTKKYESKKSFKQLLMQTREECKTFGSFSEKKIPHSKKALLQPVSGLPTPPPLTTDVVSTTSQNYVLIISRLSQKICYVTWK